MFEAEDRVRPADGCGQRRPAEQPEITSAPEYEAGKNYKSEDRDYGFATEATTGIHGRNGELRSGNVDSEKGNGCLQQIRGNLGQVTALAFCQRDVRRYLLVTESVDEIDETV